MTEPRTLSPRWSVDHKTQFSPRKKLAMLVINNPSTRAHSKAILRELSEAADLKHTISATSSFSNIKHDVKSETSVALENRLLEDWRSGCGFDIQNSKSTALILEMKLLQLLRASESFGDPNRVRILAVWEVFGKFCDMLGPNFSPICETLKVELSKSIFCDPNNGIFLWFEQAGQLTREKQLLASVPAIERMKERAARRDQLRCIVLKWDKALLANSFLFWRQKSRNLRLARDKMSVVMWTRCQDGMKKKVFQEWQRAVAESVLRQVIEQTEALTEVVERLEEVRNELEATLSSLIAGNESLENRITELEKENSVLQAKVKRQNEGYLEQLVFEDERIAELEAAILAAEAEKAEHETFLAGAEPRTRRKSVTRDRRSSIDRSSRRPSLALGELPSPPISLDTPPPSEVSKLRTRNSRRDSSRSVMKRSSAKRMNSMTSQKSPKAENSFDDLEKELAISRSAVATPSSASSPTSKPKSPASSPSTQSKPPSSPSFKQHDPSISSRQPSVNATPTSEPVFQPISPEADD